MTGATELMAVRERVLTTLAASARVLGQPLHRDARRSDFSGLLTSVGCARSDLARWAGTDPSKVARTAALDRELAMLEIDLQAHEVVRRRESVARLHEALHRLQRAESTSQLAQEIPGEVAKLGFHRVLFSWVDRARWVPESFHTTNGPAEARAVMEAGSPPYWHTGRLLEREMVKHRRPMLVHHALDHPEVHLDIQAVMHSTSYVAAPVVRRSQVVAFLHADQNVESGDVDEIDRDVMHLFAEGVSLALDRVSALEELASVRARIGAQATALSDMVAALAAPGPTSTSGSPEAAHSDGVPSDRTQWSSVLTRREEQVLDLLAAGLSNSQIGERLYITEGTTKTHVKNVLRKLGAENRAEAGAMRRGAHRR